MPAPNVSVVMPAYNAELYISESIESVISQTYTNWELLIVDDGSTDNTKEIIQSFCKKDNRIKYIYQQNGKQGKARNLALKHASGNYIAFLDADDVWVPHKLHIQLQQLEEKKADLVFSDCFIITGSMPDTSKLMNSGKGYFSGKDALTSFLEQNKIPVLSVLAKAGIVYDAKGFTEKASVQDAEDYHLWLRLLLNGNIFYGSELVLAGYRKHNASSTQYDKLAVAKVLEALNDLKQNYKMNKAVINNYQKKWFTKYHYSSNQWNKKVYNELIKKNCKYVGKPGYSFIFQAIYPCLGFNITRRLINKVINNTILL